MRSPFMNSSRTSPAYLETGPAPGARSATPDLDALARLLDSAFRIPGLNIRVGLDPIIGLIPGIGDIVATLVSLYILAAAQRYGIPRITTLRMGLNIGIDAIIGAIPIVGDLFDLTWKANQRNVALLKRHMNTPLHLRHKARRGDWLYVVGIAAVLVTILAAALYGAYLSIAAIVSWLSD
jgi:hypothetical protein